MDSNGRIMFGISKPKTYKVHCQVDAINNAIFLHLTHVKLNLQEVLPSGLSYSAYYDALLKELKKSSTELNILFKVIHVLYDSIWAIELTINRSLSVLMRETFLLPTSTKIQGMRLRMCSMSKFHNSHFKEPLAG